MKAILLALITTVLFYSAIQVDKVRVVNVFQKNALDVLDPSWPKLA